MTPVLIPVLFVITHIAADGAVWNFATGEKFSPMCNVVSSYAWRSPAGWAMVACMVGFAWVMGFISWHAAKRGPGFLAWFTAVVAAMAMVQEMWSGGLSAVGVPLLKGSRSPEYYKSLRSHWLHNRGIGAAQIMILLSVVGARYLWERRRKGADFWLHANVLVLICMVAGIFGRLLLPDFNGLTQRVAYLGIYLWMLLVVREIERQRAPVNR